MDTGTAVLKRERLAARVTPEQKKLFLRAAELTGRSLTEFLVASAQTAAEEAIRTHQVIELTANSTQQFVKAFLNPGKPSETMKKYNSKYQRLVTRK
ncbi:MAG: DUF1778 domain-containing protein [Dehalococcoidia bacterium]|nr:DUF1778 domain-containing protein [Dehalococcoidia bacterium]